MENQTQEVGPKSQGDPEAMRENCSNQARCLRLRKQSRKDGLFSCLCFRLPHLIPLLELTGSPVGVGGVVILPFLWLWLIEGGSGPRTQQMEPVGDPAGTGLGWILNPTWHLFLLLPPYVGISPPMSISRFPLAQGWFGNTSSVVEGDLCDGQLRRWPEVREPHSCPF